MVKAFDKQRQLEVGTISYISSYLYLIARMAWIWWLLNKDCLKEHNQNVGVPKELMLT